MAQPQRQPLGELPLSRYLPVDVESSSSGSSSKFKKAASLSPAGILSPPKRRILAAEGLLSPSKSPARRLLFASAADTPRSGSGSSSVMSQLAADMVQVAMASSTPHHHSSGSSSGYTSSLSSSASSSLLSSPTTSSRSSSKLSLGLNTAANPSTPQHTRTRPRPLAPSPEIVDSPMSFADEGPILRPTSLKRLRSNDSSSSTGAGGAGLSVNSGPSPTKSPTPKRRNLARATSPSPAPLPPPSSTPSTAVADSEDLFDTEVEDKENVPPPRRRKPVSSSSAGVFKAPLPPARTGLGLRDTSITPRATKTREPTYGTYLSPSDIRTRRMVMEAEVDMPDVDETMHY